MSSKTSIIGGPFKFNISSLFGIDEKKSSSKSDSSLFSDSSLSSDSNNINSSDLSSLFGNFSDGFSIGNSLGSSLGKGIADFFDSFVNGAFGDIIKSGSGDPDYTAAQLIGDLFTGGAVSSNKETRNNNAWSRAFSENERDYSRAWDSKLFDYQSSLDERNYQLQADTLSHQIDQDSWNRDYILNQNQYLAADMSAAGLNPLSGGSSGSAFGSSAGVSNINSNVSSPGRSSPASLSPLVTFASLLPSILQSQTSLKESQLNYDLRNRELAIEEDKIGKDYINKTKQNMIDARKAGLDPHTLDFDSTRNVLVDKDTGLLIPGSEGRFNNPYYEKLLNDNLSVKQKTELDRVLSRLNEANSLSVEERNKFIKTEEYNNLVQRYLSLILQAFGLYKN
ncbi:hypothetical protein [Capybara microvirus Cap3_SP_316]|nr:hypothetical protein [Capybara microvirus Cap3_SP_316]